MLTNVDIENAEIRLVRSPEYLELARQVSECVAALGLNPEQNNELVRLLVDLQDVLPGNHLIGAAMTGVPACPAPFPIGGSMNKIDKLMMQLKRPSLWMHLAFIERDESRGQWMVVCNMWDGVSGSAQGRDGWKLTSHYNTLEEAQEAVEAIAALYPGCKEPTVLVDDLGERE